MKYLAPKYELNSIEANDVVAASPIKGNNCTIAEAQGTFVDDTVTQVSGMFDSLVRK